MLTKRKNNNIKKGEIFFNPRYNRFQNNNILDHQRTGYIHIMKIEGALTGEGKRFKQSKPYLIGIKGRRRNKKGI